MHVLVRMLRILARKSTYQPGDGEGLRGGKGRLADQLQVACALGMGTLKMQVACALGMGTLKIRAARVPSGR